MNGPAQPPLFVSVIVPAFRSERTIGPALEAIGRQGYAPREVVVVDSSPDDLTRELVRGRFPGVIYEHSPARLLPHAARNRGVVLSRGECLVFTDPDIYPRDGWLHELVRAYREHGGAVVGAIACHGTRWLDTGIHLAKFDGWLPNGRARDVDICPTGNMIVGRAEFERTGGFDGGYMLGDALFSWKLTQAGTRIRFAPGPVVEHHHVSSWRGFLREMRDRGGEFARLRAARQRLGRARLGLLLAASLLPLRLSKRIARGLRHAWDAGLAGAFLRTLPVVCSGHAAWLWGETCSYARLLSKPAPPPEPR